jgi:hypothetical protein
METVLGIQSNGIDGAHGGAVFGEKIGIMGKLFGCWHKELSRPFTNRRTSYRSCLNCGALKKFDTENLKTSGPFYYPNVA